MEKNVFAEVTSLMEFLDKGIVNFEDTSQKLGLDPEDLKLAFNTWKEYKGGTCRKGIICLGKVSKALEEIL